MTLQIRKYEICEWIGSGRSGTVFKAIRVDDRKMYNIC